MSAGLERHYRRLLACYPAAYQREYGEEMLGVLMHGADDRKRRPGLAETADLIRTALVLRLRGGPGRLVSPLWRDAAAALGLVAVVLELARSIRPLDYEIGWHLRLDSAPWIFPSDWPALVVWAAVAVAVFGGWRLAAMLGGWLAVLVEVVSLVLAGRDYGYTKPAMWWSLVLALVTASLLSLGLGGRPGRSVLGRRAVLLIGGAALTLAVLAPLVEISRWQIYRATLDGKVEVYQGPYPPALGLYALASLAVVALLVLAALAGTAAPVRRRIVALGLPLLTLLGLAQIGLDPPFVAGITFAPPLLVGSLQVPLLAVLPVLVFLLAVLLVRRRERRLAATLRNQPH